MNFQTFGLNMSMPELLTLREACRLISVHPNTLRNWEKSGKLQAIRIGARRDRRYTKQAIWQLYQQATGQQLTA